MNEINEALGEAFAAMNALKTARQQAESAEVHAAEAKTEADQSLYRLKALLQALEEPAS